MPKEDRRGVNRGVNFYELGAVCTFQRGRTITQKEAVNGDVPVIAGGHGSGISKFLIPVPPLEVQARQPCIIVHFFAFYCKQKSLIINNVLDYQALTVVWGSF